MKTIILCGGFGSRLKEETEFKPKPLISIGNRPILWHIMKIYSHYGYNKFILALGYKGDMIKNYFLNQRTFLSDFTLDTLTNEINFHNQKHDCLEITFAETELESLTGERILRVKKYITENEFMVTYGDGVSDININELIAFHRKQGTIGTITGFHPYSKYGLLDINNEKKLVTDFNQKPLTRDYVNGGFMIFKKEAFNYFDNGPMENSFEKLLKENQLSIFEHKGFWKAMDTYQEMGELNKLWRENRPWAVWEKENK